MARPSDGNRLASRSCLDAGVLRLIFKGIGFAVWGRDAFVQPEAEAGGVGACGILKTRLIDKA